MLDWARTRLPDLEAITAAELSDLAKAYLGAARACRLPTATIWHACPTTNSCRLGPLQAGGLGAARVLCSHLPPCTPGRRSPCPQLIQHSSPCPTSSGRRLHSWGMAGWQGATGGLGLGCMAGAGRRQGASAEHQSPTCALETPSSLLAEP